MREEGFWHAHATSDQRSSKIVIGATNQRETPLPRRLAGRLDDSPGHQMMKALSILSLMAALFFAGCKKEEASPPKSSTAPGGNPLTAPVDYLGAAARAKQNAAKTVSTAGLDKSIQLFYANEGRYPKDLNELVRPDYLGSIPPPPVGMRYDYNPTSGVVKVVPQ